MAEMKKKGPAGTTEEGKKKSEADKMAHVCQICRQSFIVTAKAQVLVEHAHSKHPKSKELECFPELTSMGWSTPG